MPSAIQKEKSLKRYPRDWKINLIAENNPEWLPLHPETGEFMPFEYDVDHIPKIAHNFWFWLRFNIEVWCVCTKVFDGL